MPQRNSIQRNVCEIATVIGVSIIVIMMLVGYWKIQQDDSYIYYSYAKNIVHGHGYVFNIGERINATTSTLYTILLSIIGFSFQSLPFVTIPMIGHLIGAISLFITCYFFMKLFISAKSDLFPYLIPLTFLLNPLLLNSIGMENFLALMFAMLCLFLHSTGRYRRASIACAFAVLARPDMFLLAAVIVVYDVFQYRRWLTISMILMFTIPVLAWLLFNSIYFENLLPSTLSVKLAQTASGRWGEGRIFLKGLIHVSTWRSNIIRNGIAFAAFLGFWMLVTKFRNWKLFRYPYLHIILLWNLLYLLVYGLILNPPSYPWYYTPLSIGFAIIFALPVEYIYRVLSQIFVGKKDQIAIVILIMLVIFNMVLPIKRSLGLVTEKYEIYKSTAEWLNENTEVESSVGANEVGILRYYYTNGTVIDGLGLVTPGVAEHVGIQDYGWYIHHYRPDFLMFTHPHRSVLESMVERSWFQEDYKLRAVIDTQRKAVAIYERLEK